MILKCDLKAFHKHLLRQVITEDWCIQAISICCHKTASFETIQMYNHAKKLQTSQCSVRLHFAGWFCAALCNGDDDTLLNYIHRRGIILIKWLSKSKLRSAGQKIITDKNVAPLRDVRVGVCWAVSVTRITEMLSATLPHIL